jgi:hypothetical protein
MSPPSGQKKGEKLEKEKRNNPEAQKKAGTGKERKKKRICSLFFSPKYSCPTRLHSFSSSFGWGGSE